ncbi:sensor histidine kinase [Paenibacillus dendritiformis]|nr:ATP-binding protein [Paenibacillus dendritiformis]
MYDATLLYRALSNILMNALRHNPPGTTVRIALREEANQAVILIEDNGVGIPEPLQDHIFEPFTRGDRARRSDGGAGLGLSIAKQIIDKHGGAIHLDRFEGWTRFWITMPAT